MPALKAIIGADASPMAREFAMVERMSAQTSARIARNFQTAGSGHGGQGGIIRETLVLMRELASGRALSPRTAGSFTILLQRLGLLKAITGDNVTAARVLADAWEVQSEKGNLAAAAALRKAAASSAALYAEGGETEANLALAISDEQAAAAAIIHAKATNEKAVASAEAAAAQEAEAGAVSATVGPLGVVLGIVLAIGAGFYGAAKAADALKNRLVGFTGGTFNPSPEAARLQGKNMNAEGERKVTQQVKETVEAYNSAEAREKRVADVTKTRFDHMRKMNELRNAHNESAKVADRLEIDQQERAAEIENKKFSQRDFEREAGIKKSAADAINVPSEKHDADLVAKAKADADSARKYLEDTANDGSVFNKRNALRAYNQMSNTGVTDEDIVKADADAKKKAQDAIAQEKISINQKADNDLKREEKERLRKQEGAAKSAAAKIGQDLPNLAAKNAEKNKDEAEESAAELSGAQNKMAHGHVNNLQQVGAYTVAAVDIQRRMLGHLGKIEKNTDHLGTHAGGSGGKVKY